MMRSREALRCASGTWSAPATCRAATRGLGARDGPLSRRTGRSLHCNARPTLSYPRCHSSRPIHTSQPSRTAKPTATIDPSDPLPERFRSVMRILTHPVVVLTSHDGTHPRAMTMSSFTSLTLSPTPLVTFNVATPSRTLDAIAHSPGNTFNVHILSADERGAGVGARFTRGNADGLFEGVEYGGEDGEAPILGGDGVVEVLRCRLASQDVPGGLVRVKDHVIVVAEVLDMLPGNAGAEFGLAYTDRRYRRAGNTIEST